MYVSSVSESDHRLTLEAMIELHNALVDEPTLDPRALLTESGFSRAPEASAASMQRVVDRMAGLAAFLIALPCLALDSASARIGEELTEIPINPSIVDHGGLGPHIHWTPPTARFDDQIMADVLMALAHEICDNGTTRFGVCNATDCERLFYDATRNRSRRFCSDQRCASRTHTADHRRRQSGPAGNT